MNAEHSGIGVASQRVVIKADYSVEDWPMLNSARPSSVSPLKVVKTWADAEGATCCQYVSSRSPWSNAPDLCNAWFMSVDKARKTIAVRYGSTATAEDALVFPDHIAQNNLRNTWFYRRRR